MPALANDMLSVSWELRHGFWRGSEKHRAMAEGYRTLARCAADEGLKVHYRELAKAYDRLADNEARVDRDIKLSN